MAVKVYRSTDTSAPVLNGSVGTFINVLDACLVNGYGDKTSMGWTKEYSGTNTASYQMPSGTSQSSLNVNDNADTGVGSNYARLRGFQDATATGIGVSAGVNPFPTDAQVSNGLYVQKSSATGGTVRRWVLVGDDTRFYLWIDTNSDLVGSKVMFFGDIYSYVPSDTNPCAIIGANTSQGYNMICDVCQIGSSLGHHYLACKYNGSNPSYEFGKLPMRGICTYNHMASGGANYLPYPDPITGEIILSPMYIHEGAAGNAVIRGFLPGFWYIAHNQPYGNGDQIIGQEGTDLEGRTFEVFHSKCSSGNYQAQFALEISDTQLDIIWK